MPKEQETGQEEETFELTEAGYYDPLTISDDDSETDTNSQEPPETGEESPEDAKASNNGQEDEPGEGQGELADDIRAFMEKHGFKSVEALEENYAEKQRKANEDQSVINNLLGKMEALEAKISDLGTKTEPKDEGPKYTDDQLTDLLTEKPSEFIKVMSESILDNLNKAGPLKELSKAVGEMQKGFNESQGDNVLRDLRSDYTDFKDFEGVISEKLEKMGSSLKGMKSREVLEELYLSAKKDAFLKELLSKKKEVQNGNEAVEEQAKKTSKIGAGADKTGIDEQTPKSDKKKEEVKTPVGKLTREDLDLLHDPTMLTVNVPPGVG